MRTVLFYRDFRKFHGGHLKVWDYFNHVRSSPEFEPRIAFADTSVWTEENPWREARELVVESAAEVRPDVFFVAGRDWQQMDSHPMAGDDVPVINFVQHVRHADPDSNRFQFLTRKAIRVCVSEVVADAVRATGIVNGPVFANPNSVDIEALAPRQGTERDIDVLIAGLKQPDLGARLAERLERDGRRVELLSGLLPRGEYLDKIGRARVTVFLPNEAEGFYLPPLEGMAMETLVVCPEHDGEHAIYRPPHNCFRPAYTLDEVTAATESGLALGSGEAASMLAAARETADEHSLKAERQRFLDVLHRVDELW